jgi:hypothetical protein
MRRRLFIRKSYAKGFVDIRLHGLPVPAFVANLFPSIQISRRGWDDTLHVDGTGATQQFARDQSNTTAVQSFLPRLAMCLMWGDRAYLGYSRKPPVIFRKLVCWPQCRCCDPWVCIRLKPGLNDGDRRRRVFCETVGKDETCSASAHNDIIVLCARHISLAGTIDLTRVWCAN